MPVDLGLLIEALIADLEPADARALARDLARMIDLGVLKIEDADVSDPRVGIAACDPAL
jgi:hypothetical protein